MTVSQRSIILVPFPFSDLSSQKRRPAMVVSNKKFNQTSNDIICCAITKNPQPSPEGVSIDNRDMEEGQQLREVN